MKIDFEFETEFGTFRDALHLEDNNNLTEEQIEEMKQERLQNWLAIVNAPQVEQPKEIPAETVTIEGETYNILNGVPPTGAKLVEVNTVWYYKV